MLLRHIVKKSDGSLPGMIDCAREIVNPNSL